ncbi:hypothetical protein [Curtobacterium sp. MCBD17_003]|uniref:hypothetical protein n=1 Tax=Curtobacterium sp. MCBD17_003 TaxID=2175667 RepID=UPI000DA87FAF|nr:hypothetical protein [Curtobacterium sp. MCBD17_003]WIE54202.1 hypothetical protein DEI88_013920 [Curtobacterium sp. MCBD17_003]
MTDLLISYPPELLLKKHVAHLLSTSEWGVSQLVAQKKLIPVDDGGKWQKFRLDDVRAYIRSLPEKH